MTKDQMDDDPTTFHLRRIAVYVDEPDPGQFYWVLIESKHDITVWEDIGASNECFHSWINAHVAGNAALMAHVENEVIGPLAPGEDENGNPVGGMPIAD